VEKKSAAGAACCEGATDIGSGARESPGSQWPFLGRLVPATEHFVCAAGWMSKGMTLLERVRAKLRSSDEKVKDETTPFQISLVSSPGYAVLDSGCGKTIIGAATLESFRKIWNIAGINQPEPYAEENVFRFGNGSSEVSKTAIELPVCLAERQGVIRAAIVKGDAPLLLSRPAMKTLAAEMDFAKDELRLFGGNTAVSMQVNTAGQYMIPVTEFPVQQPLPKIVKEPATTVLAIESDDPEPASEQPSPEGECTTASVTSDAVPVPREGVVMSTDRETLMTQWTPKQSRQLAQQVGKLEQSRTNLADALTTPNELAGSVIHVTVYGMTPAQFIFGRNPKIPENLMDEPCEVIPATASLYVGRNLVIVHKRQVLRCAPEQIRASTTEERQLVRAPHAELLGLKHAFETGQIASRQYVDLVSGDYPTVAAEPAEQSKMLPDEPESAPPSVASDHPRAIEPLSPAPAEEGVRHRFQEPMLRVLPLSRV
ncbi:unnamed protein product, partial [Cladocopium goreaui]